jgi:hypothetical protein
MSPDPDSDILRKLDRQERFSQLMARGAALLGCLVAAGMAYLGVTKGLGGDAQLAQDLAVLVFIFLAVWAFIRLIKLP